MRCRLLSALVLLGAISFVHADYVMIVVNLNAQDKGASQKGGPGGGPPGGGLQGGFPPAGGFQGGAPPGGGTGPMMAPPGRPGMGGPAGGPPPGAMGGMTGMGGMGGMRGPAGDPADAADESPDLVVVIVEDRNPITNRDLVKFTMRPDPRVPGSGTLKLHHRWKGTTELIHKSDDMETIVLMTPSGKPLKSIDKQFAARYAELTKEKEKDKTPPSTDDSIKLARWALSYGLVQKFEDVMEELAKTDKTNSVVVAYLAVKADLGRPVSKDAAAKSKGKLLEGYRLAPSENHHHFALLHNTEAADLKGTLDRLERDYKRFYYWWAINGIHLPPPATAPVAVLTNHGNDFRTLQKNLSASPTLNDSFEARREGISVYSSKRSDPVFTRLEMTSKQFWDMGFDRRDVVKGGTAGVPKQLRTPAANSAHRAASIRALILKALEDEWEATAMSNESARQLMFASKLLPANVHVPEWLQFGAGSFFETPMQSPFGGPGSPSPYWLPRFKENNDPKAKKYGATALETLVGVVTDAHFRARPQGAETPEAVTRRARAAAWSLYFFLAQNELRGLQKYFKEIGRMPRDIELDATVLKAAFARAFGCANADGTPHDAKLAALASRWIEFTRTQTMEAEAVHKLARSYYEKMTKPAAPPANTGGNTGGIPGFPGGNPNPGRP
jgi:hypothetical protein